MSPQTFIAEDLVRVKTDGGALVLAWGDPVEVLGSENGRTRVRITGRDGALLEGTAKGNLRTQDNGVLKLSLVDVQQGDGMVLETPSGKVMLIDGGDNQLFARYLAARFRDTSEERPLDVAAILVTHGDADHFDGLRRIADCERHAEPRKRLFLQPRRVLHNGIVKGSSDLPVETIFGRTITTEQGSFLVELFDDLREVDEERLNRPFRAWQRCLQHWSERGNIEVRRVAFGDGEAFGFLREEGIEVDVYGPIPERIVEDGREMVALPLLHEPPPTIEMPDEEGARSLSASHTINGHSVVLRLRHGNVRFLLGGDLNQESMAILRERIPSGGLEAEILKVPHHGSADFDDGALRAIAPVVSVISSGDEDSRKDHIHPRATLMGALGRASRGDTPLVFCTELAAFFTVRGPSVDKKREEEYFGFERTTFGIIHVRTDGRRVLVFTHSSKAERKEAYRFQVDADHKVRFEDVEKR